MSDSDVAFVTKVLTASERGEIHTTIERALALLGRTPGQRVELVRADGASEALSIATAEQPRIAFLDVTIGRGAGVGLVHFLQSVVPGTKLGFGSPIEDGFYYDFDAPRPLT